MRCDWARWAKPKQATNRENEETFPNAIYRCLIVIACMPSECVGACGSSLLPFRTDFQERCETKDKENSNENGMREKKMIQRKRVWVLKQKDVVVVVGGGGDAEKEDITMAEINVTEWMWVFYQGKFDSFWKGEQSHISNSFLSFNFQWQQ